jgi:hypothetical protein
MGLKTRTLGVVAGVVLAATMTAVPVGATVLPNAVGTVHCTVKGSLKFVPPLVLGGTSAVTVTLATTEVGCTGTGDAVNITGGSSKTSHTEATNDCSAVLQAPFQASSGTLKWKVATGTQKWASSTISFTSGSSGGDGVTTPFTLDESGSSTGGSFSGNTATAHAQIKNTLAQIQAKCVAGVADPTKGLKSLTIISPQSTFDLS